MPLVQILSEVTVPVKDFVIKFNHSVSGRNRNLQGLAAAMLKLWEKCEIAKIAIKRGVQNTSSELMADELKVSERLFKCSNQEKS